MSTRSYIGYKDGNNVIYAYCHFDGYIEHNGVILNECYSTLNKVKTLVDRGDFSSLSANIKGIQYYENEPSGKCNLEEYFKINIEDGIDFSYLYEEGKGWSVVDGFNRYNLNDYIEKHRDNEIIKNMKELLSMNYQTWDIKNKFIHSLYDETANVVEIFFFDTLVTNGDGYIYISIPVKDKNEAFVVSENICGHSIEKIIESYGLESDYFAYHVNKSAFGNDFELWSYFAEIMQEKRIEPFRLPDVKIENVDLTFNVSAYKDECNVEYIYDNGCSSYLSLTDEMKEKVFKFVGEKRQNTPLKTDEREER